MKKSLSLTEIRVHFRDLEKHHNAMAERGKVVIDLLDIPTNNQQGEYDTKNNE